MVAVTQNYTNNFERVVQLHVIKLFKTFISSLMIKILLKKQRVFYTHFQFHVANDKSSSFPISFIIHKITHLDMMTSNNSAGILTFYSIQRRAQSDIDPRIMPRNHIAPITNFPIAIIMQLRLQTNNFLPQTRVCSSNNNIFV
jgi:hypothetical protein